MWVKVTSVLVNDQARAHKFYTEVLGFVTKTDIVSGDYRWLTVVSPDDPDGVELLLEPMANPAAPPYQKALYDSGTPLTMFSVNNVQAEYERMRALGVQFRSEPISASWGTSVIFDDTCGNLILINDA